MAKLSCYSYKERSFKEHQSLFCSMLNPRKFIGLIMFKSIAIMATAFTLSTFASNIAREGHYVFDESGKILNDLKNQKTLIIDHVTARGFEVYGPQGVSKWLDHLGAHYRPLQEAHHHKAKAGGELIFGRGEWPTHEQITERLQKLAQDNAKIFKLFSIGESVEGRQLWVMKISDNVEEDEKEPEFKYVANMHGDEIVGRDLMMMFLDHIATSYNQDAAITDLVNNTEIFIMPTLNPDGSMKRRRANANWVDINRDFPDFTTTDNTNTPSSRTVETKAMMKFQAQRHFSLSANFHGGDVVVNYPWDTTAKRHPFQDLVEEISLSYSKENEPMYNSNDFENGIVRGFQWYEVNGGMQDWSYFYHDDLQVTVELSHQKWPNYKKMPKYFDDNKESLVSYMKNIHQGLGFYLKGSLESGDVKITNSFGDEVGNYPFFRGEFYKVLPEGEYHLEISVEGQVTRHVTLMVTKGDLNNKMIEI
jgi:hypothetical protein